MATKVFWELLEESKTDFEIQYDKMIRTTDEVDKAMGYKLLSNCPIVHMVNKRDKTKFTICDALTVGETRLELTPLEAKIIMNASDRTLESLKNFMEIEGYNNNLATTFFQTAQETRKRLFQLLKLDTKYL